MALEVKVLSLGDIALESSFLVLGRNMGTVARVPTFGFLILGGNDPILVDTGYVNPDIMRALGMDGIQREEDKLVNRLAEHGVRPKDVRYVLHTHLHIDHAGLSATPESPFPATTIMGIHRRELEYSVSGIMTAQYPPSYIKPLIDRLHVPKGLRLFDLDLSGPEELVPGVVLEHAGAHTEGSMNIIVETAEGKACICGDVIYDINDQVIQPWHQVGDYEPATTGNQGTSKRQEKAAIKKALNSGKFILPVHDYPAVVQNGAVVGRLVVCVPGEVVSIVAVPPRNWYALGALFAAGV
ncbi:MAG: MBL fold metallo-hydrolase [Roseiflexaceae bacterium]|nr:MBL fold metallo-hydrolase [Roseiflexaceae bacterium]